MLSAIRHVDQRNEANRGRPYIGRPDVLFRWLFRWKNYNEHVDVTVRVDMAVDQSVPLPTGWQTALQCLDLRRLAADAFATFEPPLNAKELEKLRCECLGAAKPVQISDGGHHVPGACVALTNEIGARTNYILVAHERDGIWLCHPGMFQGDVPDSETLIFHEDGLVRKNIHTEAWDLISFPDC